MKLTNFINTSPRWALSRRKTENERLHQERYTEVASKFPRIAEIDDEIKHNSLQIAMLRVMADDSSATLSDIGAEDLDSQIKNLIDEKKQILTGAGYPEDYLDPIVTCPVCQDQGYIDHRMCDCLKQLMITNLYRNSNLDKILEKENFDTFSLDYYSTEPFGNLPSPHKHMEDVLDKSKAFVQNFNSENKNILIYGDTGLGKTFLTNCIAKELLDQGHSVIYLTAIELFEDVLDVYLHSWNSQRQNMSEDELSTLALIYKYIYESELLIIDDLGTEDFSSFVISQLFDIVNRRIMTGRSTIISTNLDMLKISERYTDRVSSRFIQSYDEYYLYGKDIRYQKKYKSLYS